MMFINNTPSFKGWFLIPTKPIDPRARETIIYNVRDDSHLISIPLQGNWNRADSFVKAFVPENNEKKTEQFLSENNVDHLFISSKDKENA